MVMLHWTADTDRGRHFSAEGHYYEDLYRCIQEKYGRGRVLKAVPYGADDLYYRRVIAEGATEPMSQHIRYSGIRDRLNKGDDVMTTDGDVYTISHFERQDALMVVMTDGTALPESGNGHDYFKVTYWD